MNCCKECFVPDHDILVGEYMMVTATSGEYCKDEECECHKPISTPTEPVEISDLGRELGEYAGKKKAERLAREATPTNARGLSVDVNGELLPGSISKQTSTPAVGKTHVGCEKCCDSLGCGYSYNCPCHELSTPTELYDCSGCTDDRSEGTHQGHTKQHPCRKGGDPNCGYCFPTPTEGSMEERFDREFTELRFGDGSPAGGGKGTYSVIRENFSLDEVKRFITQEKERSYLQGFGELADKVCEIVVQTDWQYESAKGVNRLSEAARAPKP